MALFRQVQAAPAQDLPNGHSTHIMKAGLMFTVAQLPVLLTVRVLSIPTAAASVAATHSLIRQLQEVL